MDEGRVEGSDHAEGDGRISPRFDEDAAIEGESIGLGSVNRGTLQVAQLFIPRQTVKSSPVSAEHRSLHQSHNRRAHVFREWWMEIAACFPFIAALLAIAATL